MNINFKKYFNLVKYNIVTKNVAKKTKNSYNRDIQYRL